VARYLNNQAKPTATDVEDAVARYLNTKTQALGRAQPSASVAGFDWADAGIGAAGMLGIMLLAGTAALPMREGRRRLKNA
jgi:hypothetical protein